MTGASLSTPVFCRHCAQKIEGCTGVESDRMHSRTRSERCGTTGVGPMAEPEFPSKVQVHQHGRRVVA
jgi:hypothetical protein